MKVNRKDVKVLVEATFPEYRGRKFRLMASNSVVLADLNWSGGSRSVYRACTIAGQPTGDSSKYNAQAPWANQAEGQTMPIPPGFVVVEHSDFCGKDMGLRIYVNPADMPRGLPAGGVGAV